jgi:hypothetical protein
MPMRLWTVAVIVLLAVRLPSGQSTFHMSGVATDYSGMPLPGAKVMVNAKDRPSQEGVTGNDGRFSFEVTGEVGDRFRITFEMSGFATTSRDDLVVPQDGVVVVNVQMRLAPCTIVDFVRPLPAGAVRGADAIVRLRLSPAVHFEHGPDDCQFAYVVDPAAIVLNRVKMRSPKWRSASAIPIMLIDEDISGRPGDEFIAFLDWNHDGTQLVALFPTAVSRGKLDESLSSERGFGPGASVARVMRALRSMCRKKSDGC